MFWKKSSIYQTQLSQLPKAESALRSYSLDLLGTKCSPIAATFSITLVADGSTDSVSIVLSVFVTIFFIYALTSFLYFLYFGVFLAGELLLILCCDELLPWICLMSDLFLVPVFLLLLFLMSLWTLIFFVGLFMGPFDCFLSVTISGKAWGGSLSRLVTMNCESSSSSSLSSESSISYR